MITAILNEQQLLACIINNPSNLFKIADNMFLSSASSALYKGLLSVSELGLSFTSKHILKESYSHFKELTLDMIDKLILTDYDEDSFDIYYRQLKKDFAKDQIQHKILKETLELVASKDTLDIEAVEDLIGAMQRTLSLIEDDENILMSGKQVADTYRSTLDARKRGEYKFITGDSFLDKHLTTGFTPTDITTLFAATGMGKSAFALALINKQINKRIPCLYISLELGTIATMDRLIALRKRLEMRLLYPENGDMADESVFTIVEEALDEIEKVKHFAFIEKPSLSMPELEKQIELTKKRMGVKYLVVTIDLLTMMKEFSGGGPTEYEDAMNQLHAIAKRQNVHIVAVVQANRATDGANVKTIEHLDRLRPKNMKDIKNSGAIAERSRLVLSLFRPKHYAEKLFPDDDEIEFIDDTLKVTILKQSQGEVGKVLDYLFEGKTFNIIPMQRAKRAKRRKVERHEDNN